ncbi:hypothetical protein BFO_0460 [Tannerella forsythia 92A2]|uniref:Uncharacterized protein n=1 Tax=Tannerella forsythia (strain ATCC 43037 / JCM 10827 / CCUG 21028 A / KCTC 5666 / FDC 338) TaxID=203275 RepID=G8UKW8_TANFA|nr:hypothetical protein BFO_0460 [Tannerella forsythia 92A2]
MFLFSCPVIFDKGSINPSLSLSLRQRIMTNDIPRTYDRMLKNSQAVQGRAAGQLMPS